jgi:hypothetical protein
MTKIKRWTDNTMTKIKRCTGIVCSSFYFGHCIACSSIYFGHCIVCSSFCFGHCIVCSSSIFYFWLPFGIFFFSFNTFTSLSEKKEVRHQSPFCQSQSHISCLLSTATFNNISYNGKVMRSKSSILTFVLLLYFNMLRRNDSTKLIHKLKDCEA